MDITAFYNHVSGLYEQRKRASDSVSRAIVEQFYRRLPEGSLVVDAGCGPGIEAEIGKSLGHRVIGIDRSKSMIDRFNKNIGEKSGFVGDITQTGLDSESVDAVFSSAVLLHMTKDQGKAALKEFARISKPSAFLFLLTSVGDCTGGVEAHSLGKELGLDPIYFFHWDIAELKEFLISLGYQVLDEIYEPFLDKELCYLQMKNVK